MTGAEIFVVLGGLALGWTVVYVLLGPRRRERKLEDLSSPRTGTNPSQCFETLGVSPRASAEEIRRAFEGKLEELSKAVPRVMTKPEAARVQAARASLERAYAEAAKLSGSAQSA